MQHWQGGAWELWSGTLVRGRGVVECYIGREVAGSSGVSHWYGAGIRGVLHWHWEFWSVTLAGRGLGVLKWFTCRGRGVVECYIGRKGPVNSGVVHW